MHCLMPLSLKHDLVKVKNTQDDTINIREPSASLTLEHTVPTFNPFPNKPWILRVCSTTRLKTLKEKKK